MRRHELKCQRGFTLVEIMIAAAMVAGLSLLVAKLMEDSKRGIKNAEIRNEYIVVQNRIAANMTDEVSCYETLKDIGVTDGSESTLNEIVRCAEAIETDHPLAATDPLFTNVKIRRCNSATPLYDNTTEYGDGNFTMGYRFIVNESTAPSGSGTGSGMGALEVTFQRTSKGRNKSDATYDITRRIDVIFEHDGTSLIKCFNNEGNMINTAVARACTGPNARLIGAENDSSNPLRCVHDVDVNLCGVDEVLNGYKIDDHTSTGQPATLVPNCVKLSDVNPDLSCGNNEYLIKDAAGTIGCHDIPNCAAGQVLQKAGSGLLECTALRTACNQGQVLQIQSNGSFSCVTCAAGTVVVKTTNGVVCASPTCSDPSTRFAGFNSSGVAVCPAIPDPMCANTAGSGHVSGRIVKSLTLVNGSIKAECCNPSCGGHANYCIGEVYNDPAGCRFCVGSKPRVDRTWGAWGSGTLNGHNETWNSLTEFGATKRSCRGKDGGSAVRSRSCVGTIQCNGADLCNGNPTDSESTPCNNALTASGYLTSGSGTIFSGRNVVPGSFRLVMVGGGGGGGASGPHSNNRGGKGGGAGGFYQSTNAFGSTVITSCSYTVGHGGGGGSGGNHWSHGSAGGTTRVTCGGVARTASGGNGGAGGGAGGRGGEGGASNSYDVARGFQGSGGHGPGGSGNADPGGNASGHGAGGGGASHRCGTCMGGQTSGGGSGSGGRIWYEYKYTTY